MKLHEMSETRLYKKVRAQERKIMRKLQREPFYNGSSEHFKDLERLGIVNAAHIAKQQQLPLGYGE